MDAPDQELPLHSSVNADRPRSSLPLHVWADEIRAVANEELMWGKPDGYARRRCEHLIRIAAEMAAAADERDADTIEALYRGDLLHLTPYCGGDVAILDDEGRVLLIQRKDNGLWAMPGGVFEVGETPAEGTCREAWEETGLEVNAISLSGVYDSRFCGSESPYHLYHFVFLCQPCSTVAAPTLSNETLDVKWYARNELPSLSPGHAMRLTDAFRRRDGALREAFFDPVL